MDEPHLMEVIDWVYSTFTGFNTRSMWVGGHFWDFFYTASFAFKPAIADKVKGAIVMSGGRAYRACAANISVIATAAKNDIGPLPDPGSIPTSHRCDAQQQETLGNNTHMFWPNCSPDFVHANHLMLGKGHIDYMDAELVESIVDWIKIAEQKYHQRQQPYCYCINRTKQQGPAVYKLRSKYFYGL
ncbi:MAG: hypothetical protein JXA30_13185 [Deltaproteobacteria bacterium]|nr:hypothetical protein [Deltaproteobacteria bacterium]